MNNETTTRRSFLQIALKGGLFIWISGMIAPTLAYIWPARSTGGRTNQVSAGTAADFAVGTARMAQVEGKPVMVIRKSDAEFMALSAICTHLGCIVKWSAENKHIECPCHAAVFASDGKVLSGPPPKGLDQYAVMVAGGEVLIKV